MVGERKEGAEPVRREVACINTLAHTQAHSLARPLAVPGMCSPPSFAGRPSALACGSDCPCAPLRSAREVSRAAHRSAAPCFAAPEVAYCPRMAWERVRLCAWHPQEHSQAQGQYAPRFASEAGVRHTGLEPAACQHEASVT